MFEISKEKYKSDLKILSNLYKHGVIDKETYVFFVTPVFKDYFEFKVEKRINKMEKYIEKVLQNV